MDTIAVIYVRVSTREQAEGGHSIPEQEERARAYCISQGWTVSRVYSDPGFSGAKLTRPGLQAMLSQVAPGLKVVVYKLDRLSRSQKDTLHIIEDILLPGGADLVSVCESFDTGTAFGRAAVGILSVFAQLEREQIKERTCLGKEARAKEGLFHGGGFSPIGYRYIDGHLEIDPYEASLVRMVWDMAEEGLPMHRIAEIMTRDHCLAGRPWHVSTVISVLTTPIYAGRIQWKGQIYDGQHEPIIDPTRFDAYSLADRDIPERYRRIKPFARTTLLGGLLFCVRCGARYFAKGNSVAPTGERYRYYVCYSRAKTKRTMIKDPHCKNKTYRVETLDNIVLGEIRKLTLNPDLIHTARHETDHAEERIREIDRQIERLVDLFQLGTVPVEKIRSRLEALSDEKVQLQNQKRPRGLPLEKVEDLLSSFSDAVDRADTETLKKIVHSLISRIDIDGETIMIHWTFD